MKQGTIVLFACVHNAGRSQMAAALLNSVADTSSVRALSAGTAPAGQVHPEVVTVMKEVDVDLTGARPQQLTPELASRAYLLVTMGCGEACPATPGVQREDWQLADPAGRSLEEVRQIRQEILDRVQKLVAERGWA